MRTLLEKYEMGMITDDQFLIESLSAVDLKNPGLVMRSLPEHILPRALRLTAQCLHGPMVTNYGDLPARSQVIAAHDWIEDFLRQPAQKTV